MTSDASTASGTVPPKDPLERITTDILGPLFKTKNCNRFVAVIPDQFSKLTMIISAKRTTATHIAKLILDAYIMPYVGDERMLTDSGSHLTGKCFNTDCVWLGTWLLAIADFYPQRKGQTECFNQKIVERLNRFISKHQNY